MRGYKGGTRPLLRVLSKALKAQAAALDRLTDSRDAPPPNH